MARLQVVEVRSQPQTPNIVLAGQQARLWPYAPECYPSDLLYVLWRQLQADGSLKFAFWEDQNRGSLAEFLAYFDPSSPMARPLVVAQSLADEQLIGIYWFSDVRMGHRAAINLCLRKGYRGEKAAEANGLILDYGFRLWQLQAIWASTPWRHARDYALQWGFTLMATLPDLHRIDGHERSLYVLRMTREDWDG